MQEVMRGGEGDESSAGSDVELALKTRSVRFNRSH
jgi:hypothetical protein